MRGAGQDIAQRIILAAGAEQDTGHGQIAGVAFMHQVDFKRPPAAGNGVFAGVMKMKLQEFVCLAGEGQRTRRLILGRHLQGVAVVFRPRLQKAATRPTPRHRIEDCRRRGRSGTAAGPGDRRRNRGRHRPNARGPRALIGPMAPSAQATAATVPNQRPRPAIQPSSFGVGSGG